MPILTVADVVIDMKAKASEANAQKAYEIFEDIYAERGIVQTQDEILAARKSFKAIDDISAKVLSGRYILSLPAGSGKTTYMVAWCSFIHRFNVDYSVTIASLQVKDCFDLRETLLEQGIPESDIGVIHSYSPEQMAEIKNSCPSTATPWKHRFLLITHARLEARNHRQGDLDFHGKERSILFWDEEFRSRKGFHFNVHDLRQDIIGFLEVADDLKLKDISSENLFTIKNILQSVLKAFQSHLERSDEPKELQIPLEKRSDSQWDSIMKIFRKLHGQDKLRELTIAFMQHLIAGNQMFLKSSKVYGYIRIISDDIQQILILDASYQLSKLSELDKTIIALPIKIRRSYENLTVTYMECPSGRFGTTRILRTTKEREDLMCRVADHLKSIPYEEGVLFFTHNDKAGQEFEAVIQKELSQRGFNMNESVTVNEQNKPRYPFLTWGKQNGTNEYMYCRHMLTIGVLDLGTDNVVAQAVAQTEGGYLFDDDAISPQELNVSDCAQRVYQALCRTAIRNPCCKEPCTATLFLNRNAMACIHILRKALPKAKFLEAPPVFKNKETATDRALKAIIRTLEEIPEDENEISTSLLFKKTEERTNEPISPKVRDMVMNKLRRKLENEFLFWVHEGRGLKRAFLMIP